MTDDCIFCQIVAGKIPCARVYEDDHALAFLDISPLAEGHTLVIPKRHAPDLFSIAPAEMAALAPVLSKVGRAICQAVVAPALNLLAANGKEAGQIVFHVHFHLIPRRAGDGLGFRWQSRGRQPAAALSDVAQRIADCLPG